MRTRTKHKGAPRVTERSRKGRLIQKIREQNKATNVRQKTKTKQFFERFLTHVK